MKTYFGILFFAALLVGCNPEKEENRNTTMPDRLIGVEITYDYSGGRSYAVKFEEEGVSYRFLSGSKPEKWFGVFPHNHLITESNEHLVSWHEPKRKDYVTLLINFEKEILYGSAILSGKKVHFEKATINKIQEP